MNNSKYEVIGVEINSIKGTKENTLTVFDPPIERKRTTFAVQSMTNPEIGFATTVSLENYDKAKELVKEGFDAWCCCSCRETTTHFSEEDYDWIESSGYAEPAEYLLDKFGIEYKIESCFGDDGDWLPDFDIGKIWEMI